MSTPEPPPPVIVTPEPDSRLEQLLARYDDVSDRHAALDEELKALKDGIKNEMFQLAARTAAPDAEITRIHVRSSYLRAPLVLSSSRPWRLSKDFKDDQPDIYWRYAEQGKPQWALARMR